MKRIAELTELRGVFMLMIFLYHIHVFEGGGTLGVTFFFILSGFSITLGYRDRFLNVYFNYKSFLIKRFVKLIPLHWLMLAVVAVLYFRSFANLIPEFFANLFLVQSWIPLENYYLSFNSVSWYLSDTFFSYSLLHM